MVYLKQLIFRFPHPQFKMIGLVEWSLQIIWFFPFNVVWSNDILNLVGLVIFLEIV